MARQKQMPDESRDPLSEAFAPPADETPAQRAAREAEEAEARRVSENIDEQIKLENKHKKTPVKVLLLGQEGSGASTFRELYAPRAWREERLVWRSVIHLDLVRSVKKILDALENAPEAPHWIKLPRIRLSPLCHMQRDLEVHLGLAEGEEVHAAAIPELTKQRQHHKPDQRSLAEQVMYLINLSRDDTAALWNDVDVHASHSAFRPVSLVFFCSHSLCGLLDNLDRVMERDYEPSDDDIVHVRSRTMPGLQEYHFWPEIGNEAEHEWIFYDIGCSKTRRAIWLPYLMDVNAIIFYADISKFDQCQEDDRSVNQLQYSMNLWTTICKSKLITKQGAITLVLTGCGLLREKLQLGVSLRRFITSYGDRANDMPTVTKYIREHFLAIARKYSPEPRAVGAHLVDSIDTDRRLVHSIVSSIRQGIFDDHLRGVNFIT
ncbi:guanine nucleotide binding protein, alpha subunit [Lactifluus subvellereus]|nr:guanine nucleotide binding protein, alpha subunit [Lactifluus subvellereus]